jgi:formate dehydrogenase maturation protein FdhE
MRINPYVNYQISNAQPPSSGNVSALKRKDSIVQKQPTIAESLAFEEGELSRVMIQKDWYVTDDLEHLTMAKYYKKFAIITNAFQEKLRTGNDMSESTVLEDMASVYMDMRREIDTEFSGEEREVRMRLLSSAYGNSIEMDVARPIAIKTHEAVAMDQLRAYLAERGFFERMGLSGAVKHSPLSTELTFDGIFRSVMDNVKGLASKAVLYMLNGNGKPETDEQRAMFDEFISSDSNGTLGKLSYSELKMTMNTIDRLKKADTDELKEYSIQIKASNMSSDLKFYFEAIIVAAQFSLSR